MIDYLPMRPVIARWTSVSAKVVHCRPPPWKAREYVCVSDPSSVAVAFVTVPAAVVQPEGKPVETRHIGADTVGVCGPGVIDWLVVDRWSDTVEITGSVQLRQEIAAELGVEREADLAEFFGWSDPVIVAIARRLRAGLREWTYVSELERDSLVRAAYARTFIARLGGRNTGPAGALDHVRLRRVIEYVQANVQHGLSLADLAGVAALSPFHFARAFRAATGLTPHQFVTSGRLERAAVLLRAGATVDAAAAGVGFSNLRHFRRLFREQFGISPRQLRA
jgi:AraC family transcriptional regulator